MNDYTPNSNRFKEEQKASSENKPKVDKVVTGKVKVKKETKANKIADVFIKEDIASVGSYILKDLIIPNIVNTIVDAATDAIRMTFLGEKGRTKKRSGDRTPYNSLYDGNGSRRDSSYASDARYYSDALTFDSRMDAELVLDEMGEAIRDYGEVSVAGMYDAAGMTAPYTSNRYGWRSIRDAEIKRVRVDGEIRYAIDLPKARPLN